MACKEVEVIGQVDLVVETNYTASILTMIQQSECGNYEKDEPRNESPLT